MPFGSSPAGKIRVIPAIQIYDGFAPSPSHLNLKKRVLSARSSVDGATRIPGSVDPPLKRYFYPGNGSANGAFRILLL